MRILQFFLPAAMSASVIFGGQAYAAETPPLPAEQLLADATFIESGKCKYLSALTWVLFDELPDDKFKPFFQNMAGEINESSGNIFEQKRLAHAPLSIEQQGIVNERVEKEIKAENIHLIFTAVLALHKSCAKYESDAVRAAAPGMLDDLLAYTEQQFTAPPKPQEQLPTRTHSIS